MVCFSPALIKINLPGSRINETNIQSKMINIATKILCRRVSSRELSIGFREQGNWGIYFREQGIFSIYFQGTSRFLGTREHQSILNNIFFKLSEPTKYKIYYVLIWVSSEIISKWFSYYELRKAWLVC